MKARALVASVALALAGSAAAAKITLLTGTEKQEVELKPAGDGALHAGVRLPAS